MARTWGLLFALGLIVRTPWIGAQDQRSGIVAFTHVTVIDTFRLIAQPDQTVLVSGERISDVRPSRSVTLPAGAQAIDASGTFVIPGLWDMHVHTFTHSPTPLAAHTWFFPLFIANGVTGVRDMWTTDDDLVRVAQFRKGLADGTMVVPRYESVGWLVDGPNPGGVHGANPDVVTTPQQAREFVQRAKVAGVDFIKVYDHLAGDAYVALADESRKAGIPFAGHVPYAVRASEASDAGQRSIEHMFGVDIGCSSKEADLQPHLQDWGPEQSKQLLSSFDPAKCERLLATLARNQTWQVPTLGVSAPRLPSDPRSRYLPASLRPSSGPIRAARPLQEDMGRFRRNLVAMMSKAGVPLLAGTDVSNLGLYPGFSLHDQLVLFVEAGLTPGQALQTAAYNPARFLGRLDRFGTVEKGKLADLVLLDANPLDDIHNTQKIRAVVLNGRYLDRAALDKLLADAAARQ